MDAEQYFSEMQILFSVISIGPHYLFAFEW